jgi:hypothetical protein
MSLEEEYCNHKKWALLSFMICLFMALVLIILTAAYADWGMSGVIAVFLFWSVSWWKEYKKYNRLYNEQIIKDILE